MPAPARTPSRARCTRTGRPVLARYACSRSSSRKCVRPAARGAIGRRGYPATGKASFGRRRAPVAEPPRPETAYGQRTCFRYGPRGALSPRSAHRTQSRGLSVAASTGTWRLRLSARQRWRAFSVARSVSLTQRCRRSRYRPAVPRGAGFARRGKLRGCTANAQPGRSRPAPRARAPARSHRVCREDLRALLADPSCIAEHGQECATSVIVPAVGHPSSFTTC